MFVNGLFVSGALPYHLAGLPEIKQLLQQLGGEEAVPKEDDPIIDMLQVYLPIFMHANDTMKLSELNAKDVMCMEYFTRLLQVIDSIILCRFNDFWSAHVRLVDICKYDINLRCIQLLKMSFYARVDLCLPVRVMLLRCSRTLRSLRFVAAQMIATMTRTVTAVAMLR